MNFVEKVLRWHAIWDYNPAQKLQKIWKNIDGEVGAIMKIIAGSLAVR